MHSSPRRCDIRVLDFSPVSVRRELSSARHDDDDEWSVSVETEPTVLPKRGIWKEDVWSRLPYREVVRRKAIRANGVMMDDQRLIVVCVGVPLRKVRWTDRGADTREEERGLVEYSAGDDGVLHVKWNVSVSIA